MAQNGISLAAARGNFLTWCISGFLPTAGLCRPLYVGQMLPGMTGDVGVPGQFYVIYSANEAREKFGAGSVAALMAIQHFCTCPELPLYVAPLADPATGAVAAEHTITIGGPATASGILSMGIMDYPVAVSVIVGATADSIAIALAAEINKLLDLPFTAAAVAGVVTLTAKNKGLVGNWFTAVLNPDFGDQLPAGVTVTIANGTVAGAGVLDVSPAVAAMSCPWDCVALGTEEENAVDIFLQIIRQQWLCGVQGDFRGGHLFHSKTDSAGTIAAYGRDRNNPEECVIPVRTGYKYAGYQFAAAMASRVCCTACHDPARPVQYDNGVLGCLYDSAQCATVWSADEKKAFFDAGIVNWDVAFTRGVRQTALWIEEPLTTYKFNPKTGAPDGAWQRVESRYTVVKFTRELGYWYKANYSSVALVNNGTRIPQGRRAISPRILQASILAWLRSSQVGITVDADDAELERMVRVQRTNTPDNCDPNRVNVLIDLDLVNQLARIATSIDVSPEFACIAPTVAAAA